MGRLTVGLQARGIKQSFVIEYGEKMKGRGETGKHAQTPALNERATHYMPRQLPHRATLVLLDRSI